MTGKVVSYLGQYSLSFGPIFSVIWANKSCHLGEYSVSFGPILPDRTDQEKSKVINL